jgi:hypothetical protein
VEPDAGADAAPPRGTARSPPDCDAPERGDCVRRCGADSRNAGRLENPEEDGKDGAGAPNEEPDAELPEVLPALAPPLPRATA